MHRLGRMKKQRRSTGARQRGGDLLADDARLAHSGHDNAPFALAQQLHGAVESCVKAVDQRENRGRLGFEDLLRQAPSLDAL